MLMLTRRLGEAIIVGDGPEAVVISVAEIRTGGEIKLAVNGPRHVSVDRLEVRAKKQRETNTEVRS